MIKGAGTLESIFEDSLKQCMRIDEKACAYGIPPVSQKHCDYVFEVQECLNKNPKAKEALWWLTCRAIEWRTMNKPKRESFWERIAAVAMKWIS